MRLVPKKWDYYSPFWITFGLGWLCGGAYGLGMLGFRGPASLWLFRAIFGIPFFVGLAMLLRQFQLRPRTSSSEQAHPPEN